MAITQNENNQINTNEPILEELESEPEEIGPPRYTYLLRNKFICMDCSSIEEFQHTYEYFMNLMEQFKTDGIKLDTDIGGISDDYATFYTYDSSLAEKYGFELEELM